MDRSSKALMVDAVAGASKIRLEEQARDHFSTRRASVSYVRQATARVVCHSSAWPSIGTISFFEIACPLLHKDAVILHFVLLVLSTLQIFQQLCFEFSEVWVAIACRVTLIRRVPTLESALFGPVPQCRGRNLP